jgi:hypothetical protein
MAHGEEPRQWRLEPWGSRLGLSYVFFVMPGLVPGIHVFTVG